MSLDLSPLGLPGEASRPCVLAGSCSAETEEQVTLVSLCAKDDKLQEALQRITTLRDL